MLFLRPVLLVPPAELPVSLAEVKLAVRVDGTEEDALIEGLIASAAGHLDGRTGILGRCLVRQVWRYHAASLARVIHLGMPDASEATILFQNAGGQQEGVAPELFRLEEYSAGSALVFHGGQVPYVPTDRLDRPFVIDVTFGTAAAEVAPALKQAIKLLVAHWYRNREAVGKDGVEIPLGVAALVAPYRWRSI